MLPTQANQRSDCREGNTGDPRAGTAPLSARPRGEGPGEGSAVPAIQPRLKLWVEDDGRLLLSDFRVRLLQSVHETGSVAAAAHQFGLSYRRAWGKIKELEANLGAPLVQSTVGGKCGGSTRLTPTGRTLVCRYASFRARVEQAVAEAFVTVFAEDDAARPPAHIPSSATLTLPPRHGR